MSTDNTIQIQPMEGEYTPKQALNFLTQIYHMQIMHNESKIKSYATAADIVESRDKITRLQQELFEARAFLEHTEQNVNISTIIQIKKIKTNASKSKN